MRNNITDDRKRQHNNVVKKVHWDLSKKNGLENTEKLYELNPEGAVENEEVKVLSDITQCKNVIEARKPASLQFTRKNAR